MKSYTLTRSDCADTNQRKPVTLYYIDGARVSRKAYEALASQATRTDSYLTRRSSRGRWLFDCCIFA
jgi:hypothetical protein